MNLTRRNYQQENDYWRIRAFLREVMHANGRREFSWHMWPGWIIGAGMSTKTSNICLWKK